MNLLYPSFRCQQYDFLGSMSLLLRLCANWVCGGAAGEPTLNKVVAQVFRGTQLILSLDAFQQNSNIAALGVLDYSADKMKVAEARFFGNEALGELDVVGAEFIDVRQCGVPRAKVIEGDARAVLLVMRENVLEVGDVWEGLAFNDFKDEVRERDVDFPSGLPAGLEADFGVINDHGQKVHEELFIA